MWTLETQETEVTEENEEIEDRNAGIFPTEPRKAGQLSFLV